MTEQVDVRTGQGQLKLDREAFAERYRQRFKDPIFNHAQAEIDRLMTLPGTAIARAARRR